MLTKIKKAADKPAHHASVGKALGIDVKSGSFERRTVALRQYGTGTPQKSCTK